MARTYVLGTWNLRLGRAIGDVPGLIKAEGLDALAVQEVAGGADGEQRRRRNVRRLRAAVAPARLRLAANREAGIVVRRGVRLTQMRRHVLTRTGWERGKGRPGLHPKRETVSVRLGPKGRDGIRFGSVHVPPRGGAAMPLRAAARVQALAVILAICLRWNRAIKAGHIGGWVLAGDWNHPARSVVIRALAKSAGARVVGSGVDFALVSRSLSVGDHGRARRRASSDHTPRVITVTTPKESS